MVSLLDEIHMSTFIFLVFQTLCFIFSISFFINGILREEKALKTVEADLRLASAPDHEELEGIFSKLKGSRYYRLWQRYSQDYYQQKTEAGLKAKEYFGLDVMREWLGYRSWMEMGSRLHITVGVIGALLGVALGWAREETNGLGVETTLFIFLWGVVLSALWMIVDRLLMSRLEKQMDRHAGMMTDLLQSKNEERQMRRWEKLLQDQGECWQQALSDSLESVFHPILHQMKLSHEEWSQQQVETKKRLESLEALLRSVQSQGEKMGEHLISLLDNQKSTLQRIDPLLEGVQESAAGMIRVAPQLKDVVENLDSWKEELQQMQAQQQQVLLELSKGWGQYQEIVEEAARKMETHVAEVSSQVSAIQAHWASTGRQFSELQESLDQSVQGFAKEIDTGLKHTFRYFDSELIKAMKKFSQLNHSFTYALEDLLLELEELSRSLKQKRDEQAS